MCSAGRRYNSEDVFEVGVLLSEKLLHDRFFSEDQEICLVLSQTIYACRHIGGAASWRFLSQPRIRTLYSKLLQRLSDPAASACLSLPFVSWRLEVMLNSYVPCTSDNGRTGVWFDVLAAEA